MPRPPEPQTPIATQPIASMRRDDAQDTSIAQNVSDIAGLQATTISQAATIAAQAALITALNALKPLGYGSTTLAAGTKAVALPAITAGSTVMLTAKSLLGTVGTLSYVITPATGFAINSVSVLDTSTVSWLVLP